MKINGIRVSELPGQTDDMNNQETEKETCDGQIKPALELKMITDEFTDQSLLGFDWEAIEFSGKQLKLQLMFYHPEYVAFNKG